MTSLISCVWIDIFITFARGFTGLIPAFNVMSETVPKKFTTPTFPAGMTVKICESAMIPAATMMTLAVVAATRYVGFCSTTTLRRAFFQAKNAEIATIRLKIKAMIVSFVLVIERVEAPIWRKIRKEFSAPGVPEEREFRVVIQPEDSGSRNLQVAPNKTLRRFGTLRSAQGRLFARLGNTRNRNGNTSTNAPTPCAACTTPPGTFFPPHQASPQERRPPPPDTPSFSPR